MRGNHKILILLLGIVIGYFIGVFSHEIWKITH